MQSNTKVDMSRHPIAEELKPISNFYLKLTKRILGSNNQNQNDLNIYLLKQREKMKIRLEFSIDV